MVVLLISCGAHRVWTNYSEVHDLACNQTELNPEPRTLHALHKLINNTSTEAQNEKKCLALTMQNKNYRSPQKNNMNNAEQPHT